MGIKIKKILALSAVGLCSIPVSASEVVWSGFLSAVAGKTLDNDTTYNAGFTGYDGGRYDNDLSFNPESTVGLQAQIPINDRLRGTVQFIARAGDDNNVTAEWAYLTYELTDELSINAGRFRLPLYYYSDFLDVGKAYHWIRPPAELYNGPSGLNGFNLYYSKYLGDYELSGQYWFGTDNVEVDAAPFDRVNLTNNQGINVMLAKDWWKIRGVYNMSNTELQSDTVPSPPKTKLTFWGAAFLADFDNIFFRSEYTGLKLDEGEDFSYSWYASAGYSFGQWTPHITYTDSDEQSTSGVPESTSITLGLNWEANTNTVLKIEYLEREPENDALDTVKLIAAGVDLVF